MIEDDSFRSSSQFRHWSFTSRRLEETRHNTNELAAEKLRAAFQRSRQQHEEPIKNAKSDSTNDVTDIAVQTLSVEEEMRIVEWGSDKIIQMAENMNTRFTTTVVATAIQYLRRFYLTNSPMTYHPKQITACALFLATKSEHLRITLAEFITNLDGITEDDVRAPEFLLLQGLMFTLDVRHPFRGLEGGIAELQAIVHEGKLEALQSHKDGKAQNLVHRIRIAADKSKQLLTTAAQMTDAYFLYTPSQIWLAAMLAVDQELATLYVEYLCSRFGGAGSQIRAKLLMTIKSCADMLSSYRSSKDDPGKAKEIRKVGKKLTKFQNPEKLDMVALTRAKAAEKREGSESDPEKALKKRKLEREKLNKDGNVFGPDLRQAV